jgi:hypothetical protein
MRSLTDIHQAKQGLKNGKIRAFCPACRFNLDNNTKILYTGNT